MYNKEHKFFLFLYFYIHKVNFHVDYQYKYEIQQIWNGLQISEKRKKNHNALIKLLCQSDKALNLIAGEIGSGQWHIAMATAG